MSPFEAQDQTAGEGKGRRGQGEEERLNWVVVFFGSFLFFPSFLSLFSFFFYWKASFVSVTCAQKRKFIGKITRVSPVISCWGGMDSIVTRASALGLHRHGFCCFSASKHVACPVLRVLAYLSKMGRTPQGYGESTVCCVPSARPVASQQAGVSCRCPDSCYCPRERWISICEHTVSQW